MDKDWFRVFLASKWTRSLSSICMTLYVRCTDFYFLHGEEIFSYWVKREWEEFLHEKTISG